MHHNLKQDVRYFQHVVEGRMRSLVRFNDRNYQVGDTITLQEGQLDNGVFEYTGRTVSAEISFVDNFGTKDGYVSLSIHRVGLLVVNNMTELYEE